MGICRLDAYVGGDELNAFRESIGLPPIKEKEVDCLKCGNRFTSKDYPRVRMCRRCRVVDIAPVIYGCDRGAD